MVYRRLYDIKPSLLKGFDRYQEVTQCLRRVDGEWALKDIAFTERWDDAELMKTERELADAIAGGGCVIGAFDENGAVAGFACVEGERFGEYAILSQIHVSRPARNKGVGRALFERSMDIARAMGAKKLYISAHSSRESQAFYERLGCVDAVVINAQLAEKEPFDRQLERALY